MNIKKMYLVLSMASFGLMTPFAIQAKALPIDSINVENKNGKEIVIHRLASGESYYSLGRIYNVNHKDISVFNANKKLKAGQTIKIPTNRVFPSASKKQETAKTIVEPRKVVDNVATPAQTTPIKQNTRSIDPTYIDYKVGKGETLYTIAKRFQVSVDYIKEFNKLKEKPIKAGQILRIPQEPEPIVATAEEGIISTEETVKELAMPADRYGLTQVTNKGIGVWIDGLSEEEGTMLALHKTAPVGTIIKITNPMTQRTTYAKVVGKYNDSNDTRDAIIVISKATASLIGVIDKRFLVNITYGVPNKN